MTAEREDMAAEATDLEASESMEEVADALGAGVGTNERAPVKVLVDMVFEAASVVASVAASVAAAKGGSDSQQG